MKIVFFGTSPFAAKILSFLLEDKTNSIIAVVTRPDRPQGRSLRMQPSAVKQQLLDHEEDLPLFSPEKASTPEFANQLRSLDADLFLVVAYGEIIQQEILDIPKKGAVNIHASLLPKYRGAAPMERALLAGEHQSGITLIEMVRKMDAGPMIAQASCPISEAMNLGQLQERLLSLSCDLLTTTLPQLAAGNAVRVAQKEEEATFAPKIRAEELKIDWNRSSREIHNQIRAFSPEPGAWSSLSVNGENRRIKIFLSSEEQTPQAAPGTILSVDAHGWLVACGQGALRLQEVQVEGKKRLPAFQAAQGLRQIFSFSF